MTANFLIIGDPQSPWVSTLSSTLAPLGQVQSIAEDEINLKGLQTRYDLIIVDATSVKEVDPLVGRLRTHRPEARIVVATISPTWQRAREALGAGAVSYVRKSEDAQEFLSTIKELLRKPLPKSHSQEEV